MSERVAIVVGAGGELGRATAENLAGTGYAVVGIANVIAFLAGDLAAPVSGAIVPAYGA